MPTIQSAPERDKLIAKIGRLEYRLSRSPKDSTSVQASIEHASQQIQYWRTRQVLASLDTNNPDPEVRKPAAYESRKCTEMAAEWERRKSDAAKLQIGALLEELARKIDAMATAGQVLKTIATD